LHSIFRGIGLRARWTLPRWASELLISLAMIIEDVVEFLKHVPPFQFLDEAALTDLAFQMSMEFSPKGTNILRQGGSASKYLYVIKKGGVKVFRRAGSGEDSVIEFRGQGDLFGYLSLFGNDKSRASVQAVEDTTCYMIKREAVRLLIDRNSAVREFFLKSFLNIYIDKTFEEMYARSLYFSGGDKFLFTTSVGEIAATDILTAPQDISIRNAASMMCENKISSLVIVDHENRPVGIITDRDMRGKVVARGRDVNESVSNIMSYPLLRIDANDYCFEALLRMIKYNVHHLLVVRDGALSAIVTNHDLMILQGTSPLLLAKDIEGQQDIEGLIPIAKQITNVIGILIKQGARAGNITRVITEINGALVRKILDIAERKFGRPPIQYCWIVFGTDGRKELVFRTEQENGIIYADPATTHQADEAKKYFSVLTAFARNSLIQCGFSRNLDGFSASNPQWCRPLRDWKKYFAEWVASPMQERFTIDGGVFDFRGAAGDFSLPEQLREALTSTIRSNEEFLSFMARRAVEDRPPAGFLKTVVVEKDGERTERFNLESRVLAPIVRIVRLFALEQAIKETSTLDRINLLKDRHCIVREYGEEIAHAFEFIMLLRIQHQLEQKGSGREPDNFINPDRLTNLQKKTIKEAFNLVRHIQDSIIERYQPAKR
jgi:CBS domain-containing protein